jgi:TRAP-type C4-dicarboxylate transport system permease small subunit
MIVTVLFATIARGKNLLHRGLEIALIGIFSALTLDVLWGVFSRHVMGRQSGFTEELAIYLLVWLSLLGAALTYAERGHLGVDYFVQKLDEEAQKVAAVVVELLVMAFVAIAFVYGGMVLVTETLASGQLSPALGIKVGYMYVAVPLSGVFFLMFSLEHLLTRAEPSIPTEENVEP